MRRYHLFEVNPDARRWGIRQGAEMGGCLQRHVDTTESRGGTESVTLFVHSPPSLRILSTLVHTLAHPSCFVGEAQGSSGPVGSWKS